MADDYKKLTVWNVSLELAKEVYIATKNFPKEEVYGLTAQIRKSATSVPSNIAEGSARRSNKDFTRFINIASGSLAELDTQLILANSLGFLDNATLNKLGELIKRIDQMLIKLRKSIENKATSGANLISINDQR